MPAAAKGACPDDGSVLPLTMAVVLEIKVEQPLSQLHNDMSHRHRHVEHEWRSLAQSLSFKRAILKIKICGFSVHFVDICIQSDDLFHAVALLLSLNPYSKIQGGWGGGGEGQN